MYLISPSQKVHLFSILLDTYVASDIIPFITAYMCVQSILFSRYFYVTFISNFRLCFLEPRTFVPFPEYNCSFHTSRWYEIMKKKPVIIT